MVLSKKVAAIGLSISLCFVGMISIRNRAEFGNLIYTNSMDSSTLYKVFAKGENIDYPENDLIPVDFKHISLKAMERNIDLLEYYKKSSRETEKKTRLPDVIGIGVEKCGTGSLLYYLNWHPMIRTKKNEAHFFTGRRYGEGEKFYKSILPDVNKYELSMEKTPAYFNFASPSVIARRIKMTVPKAKLWLVLCDPVNRVFSSFIQQIDYGYIKNTSSSYYEDFIESLVQESKSELSGADSPVVGDQIRAWKRKHRLSQVLTAGIYHAPLVQWFKHYDENQLHIIDGEELINDPGTVVEKMQEFLGIPKFLLKEDFVKNPDTGFHCLHPTVVDDFRLYNTRVRQCVVDVEKRKGKTRGKKRQERFIQSQETLKKLKDFFRPYNKKLFQLLGREFNWS